MWCHKLNPIYWFISHREWPSKLSHLYYKRKGVYNQSRKFHRWSTGNVCINFPGKMIKIDKQGSFFLNCPDRTELSNEKPLIAQSLTSSPGNSNKLLELLLGPVFVISSNNLISLDKGAWKIILSIAPKNYSRSV